MNTILSNLGIIYVLYNPNEDDLNFIEKISKLYQGVIIDNSTKPFLKEDKINHMNYVWLGHNTGIAHAHNIGFSILEKNPKIEYIILFDQDSRYEDNYPREICYQYIHINNKLHNLAALGPLLYIKKNNELYKSAFHKDIYLLDNFILKPNIISSGCCIGKKALENIGKEDEKLFIDFVDSEWCFRAKAKGFICGITPNVKLQHQVGQKEIHIGRHIVSISSPFRYKYQYRNLIILLSRNYIPYFYKRNYFIKFSLRYFYLPFRVSNGFKIWKYMNKGIIEGIKYYIGNIDGKN